jgi:pyruvate ferredoxin oxidoreductase alpha subunit
MGGSSETAKTAVGKMRAEGRKVGLVRLRLFRPFPADDLRKALSSAKVVAVCDRAISYGGPGGPLGSEIKSAFYGYPGVPYIANFVFGLAGRDVRVSDFEKIARRAEELAGREEPAPYEIIGLRE